MADMNQFHSRVYELVRSIPYAKVASYKQIAQLAGFPTYARQVGQALKFVQDPTIPWWRVIASSGQISHRGDAGEGAQRQRDALEEEGVEFTPSGSVSFGTYGWDGVLDEDEV